MASKLKDHISQPDTPTYTKQPVAWHTLNIPDVLARLNTDLAYGLSEDEVQRRRAEFGPNVLEEQRGRSPLAILGEQLTGIMVIILILAAVVSAFLGDIEDTVVILAIVVLNAALGFIQEYRAERAMAALKQLAVPTVRVRRDGHVREVSAIELVPGDIVLLEMGSRVPADGRLVEAFNLQVEESALTGESAPVEKTTRPLADPEAPIADQVNKVFMGTTITYGRGTAVVVETGMRTELGHIATLIQTVKEEPTPLQRRLAGLGRTLALASLLIVAVVFVAGLWQGKPLELMFLTAVSLAVAAVPEGLPAVITIALALGAQRMVQRHALIRKLQAVETLGSVTVICSDKTGTLTQNAMTIETLHLGNTTIRVTGRGYAPEGQFFIGDNPINPLNWPQLRLLLTAGALSNDSMLDTPHGRDGQWRVIGDPTEGALIVVAAKAGLDPAELRIRYPRIAEIPFTSERKRMTTVHQIPITNDQIPKPTDPSGIWDLELGHFPFVAFSKGAVDCLLEVCDRIQDGENVLPLTPARRVAVLQANDTLASQGVRVLGIAYRPVDHEEMIEENIERNLIFLGMVGMIDPPRPEAAAAVAEARAAGITPVMITGDHLLTAMAIGRSLGILRDGQRTVEGRELEEMTAEELAEIVEDVAIYARVSPEHKLKIVDAFQRHKEVVAMTGDGVNDAPALKKANIGVAMGITGTDVSKEAADMILLDDNFASIVAAVAEGRVIYDNIRKFVRYLLSTNAGEIVTMFFGILLGFPLPLLPIQILWVNLVTDGLPAIALGFEPAEAGVMRRRPRPQGESLFAGGMGSHIIRVGLLIGAGTLGVMEWARRQGHLEWQTMAFMTLALFQVWHVLALRSETELLVKRGLFTNRLLLFAVLLTFGLQLAVTYIPFLQDIFETRALSLEQLAICIGISSLGFILVEIQKPFIGRKR